MNVKVTTNDWLTTLAKSSRFGKDWQRFLHRANFVPNALRVRSRENVGHAGMIGFLAFLAICIASLGIKFGMSHLRTRNPIEKISIRKVMGCQQKRETDLHFRPRFVLLLAVAGGAYIATHIHFFRADCFSWNGQSCPFLPRICLSVSRWWLPLPFLWLARQTIKIAPTRTGNRVEEWWE